MSEERREPSLRALTGNPPATLLLHDVVSPSEARQLSLNYRKPISLLVLCYATLQQRLGVGESEEARINRDTGVIHITGAGLLAG